MNFLSYMNTRTGRDIRIALGIAVFVAGATVGGGLGIGLMAFSVLPVATGVFGICPFNPLLGQPLRACPVRQTTTKHP